MTKYIVEYTVPVWAHVEDGEVTSVQVADTAIGAPVGVMTEDGARAYTLDPKDPLNGHDEFGAPLPEAMARAIDIADGAEGEGVWPAWEIG